MGVDPNTGQCGRSAARIALFAKALHGLRLTSDQTENDNHTFLFYGQPC